MISYPRQTETIKEKLLYSAILKFQTSEWEKLQSKD